MTNLGKYYDDPNIWGAKNNAFINALKKGEYIHLAANGNEPPTIKQYTRFSVYNTESVTLSNDAITGDNEYSASASITNPISEAIFEDGADVTFTWEGTTRGVTSPAISDDTWYIYCSGSYDNSTSTIGQGVYFVSTSQPTYNYKYGGWYLDSSTRAIGQFTVASSVVSDIIEYNEINNIIYYNSDGNVGIGTKSPTTKLDVEGSISGKVTTITTGTYNDIDVTDVNIIECNTISGDITINGLSNGVKGQTVIFTKPLGANDLIFNNNNASGDEVMRTRDASDQTGTGTGKYSATYSVNGWHLDV